MDADNLPVAEVGEWALEKHERLRKYVDITRAPRRKYVQPTAQMPHVSGASYIDLFCGPGRARIRETSEVVDGSPLVAFKMAAKCGVPFSEIHLADLETENVDAAVKRVAALGGTSNGYVGRAEETAKQVVAKLNPNGLHFAFLDPFDLKGLTFETIEQLSRLKRIDLLLHVSIQDLQRNFDRYIGAKSSPLDTFAPGWRDHVKPEQSQNAFRAAYISYWKSLVQKLGFAESQVELVTGSKNQRLYWLAFLSRHRLGNDFWNEIRHLTGQRDLNL